MVNGALTCTSCTNLVSESATRASVSASMTARDHKSVNNPLVTKQRSTPRTGRDTIVMIEEFEDVEDDRKTEKERQKNADERAKARRTLQSVSIAADSPLLKFKPEDWCQPLPLLNLSTDKHQAGTTAAAQSPRPMLAPSVPEVKSPQATLRNVAARAKGGRAGGKGGGKNKSAGVEGTGRRR